MRCYTDYWYRLSGGLLSFVKLVLLKAYSVMLDFNLILPVGTCKVQDVHQLH